MKRKYLSWMGILPAVTVISCAGLSLSGYVAPELKGAVLQEKDTTTNKITDKKAKQSEKTKEEKSKTTTSNKLPAKNAISVSRGSSKATPIKKVTETGKYKDGIYTGTGTGFSGTIQVQVTITNGKIGDIKILSSSDDAAYIKRASSLLQQIKSAQSTNVDTISGATYSSNGLIEAVRNALAKATIKTNDSASANPETTKKENSETKENKKDKSKNSSEKGKFPYKDGTYLGTGEGYKGDITLAVTIKNKRITKIAVIKTSDDKNFFGRAKSILNNVLNKQTIKVDTVSGATFSSEGILEALEDALTQAKKATESSKDHSKDQETKPNSTTRPTDSKNDQEETTSHPEEGTTKNDSDQPSADNKYLDGEYTAIAICNPDSSKDFQAYNLEVTVTIKNDRITEMKDVKGYGDRYNDSNDFFIGRAVNGKKKSKGMAEQIIDQNAFDIAAKLQNTLDEKEKDKIDIVTGATCSSKALAKAVMEALQKAEKPE